MNASKRVLLFRAGNYAVNIVVVSLVFVCFRSPNSVRPATRSVAAPSFDCQRCREVSSMGAYLIHNGYNDSLVNFE